jgi:hypothetical protein
MNTYNEDHLAMGAAVHECAHAIAEIFFTGRTGSAVIFKNKQGGTRTEGVQNSPRRFDPDELPDIETIIDLAGPVAEARFYHKNWRSTVFGKSGSSDRERLFHLVYLGELSEEQLGRKIDRFIPIVQALVNHHWGWIMACATALHRDQVIRSQDYDRYKEGA